MKITLVTHHTPNFQSMADLTTPGKRAYAKKNGYEYYEQTDNWFVYPTRQIGYEKCLYLHHLMLVHPAIDWFWWSGCDVLITNHNVKLETIIDNNYHFIVCKDPCGINADSFLIRNTPQGRDYMIHCSTEHPGGSEQGHMWDDEHNPNYKTITKYLPQHVMNNYDMSYYPHMSGFDVFGQRSNWQPGDFVIHAVTGLLPQHTLQQTYEWKMKILQSKINNVIL
jgi:hypothetical protein